MIPQKQLIKHDPANGAFGDCYRTCIASILDMHPSEVPHFYAKEGETVADQISQARAWLRDIGLTVACFAYAQADKFPLAELLEVMAGNCPGVPMILSGSSGIGANHSVVVMDGSIVSDPSGNSIVGPMDCNQWQIDVISVGQNWERGLYVASEWLRPARRGRQHQDIASGRAGQIVPPDSAWQPETAQ